MKTGFFGSSNFSIPFLEVLKEKTDIALVVSTEDQPKGRGQKIISNPVKCIAQDAGIPVVTPVTLHDPAFQQMILAQHLDLVVTASYGKLIPPSVLTSATIGFFNIHPSLLPAYRGAEPIFWQIAHGIKESGASLFKMSSALDAGDIVDQAPFQIADNDNYAVVESNAIRTGIGLLRKLLDDLRENRGITLRPQPVPSKKPFYARKITFRDEEIQWKQPADTIHNQIRALSPQTGAYTLLNGKRLKILESKKTTQKTTEKPGTLCIQGKKLVVATGDFFLKIDMVKPEGKNLMKSDDFINGYLAKETHPVFSSSNNR
jgi:methionyl-tRNA formyltransferase